MDRNDRFGSLFGSSGRPNAGRRDRLDDEFEREFQDADDMFSHFNEEMNKQMEYIGRQMDDMFRNFGSIHYSPRHEMPAIEDGTDNPRDRMLKYPDMNDRRIALPDHRDYGYSRDRPSIFGNMFSMPRWDSLRPYRRDTDLDEEVAEKSISKIFEESKVNENRSPMKTYSKSKSQSYSSYKGPDGFQKFEKKHSWKNPDGTQEEHVTRQLGDKSHTVVKKIDKYGQEDTRETLNNMDRNDIPTFKDEWNNTNKNVGKDALVSIEEGDRNLFSKFFGFRPRF